MKFVLVFVSPNGTTKSTTELLEDVIEKHDHRVDVIDIGLKKYREDPRAVLEEIKKADIVGLGSPVYHMETLKPMQDMLEKIVRNKDDLRFKAFIYLNYGGITSGKAFINTVKTLKNSGIPVIGGLKVSAPHLHHQEEFPTDRTEEITAEFYSELESNGFSKIDWNRAEELFAPEKIRVNILYPFVHFIGKRRELPIHIDPEQCEECGRCIAECPVGAIEIDDKVSIDSTNCIHCYHCVVACPVEAVECPIEKLDKMMNINKKIIGTETPANKIYV